MVYVAPSTESWHLGAETNYFGIVITPRAHARARGYVIGRGVYYILYIYLYIVIYLQGLFSIFQNTHFQTPISAQEGFSSNLIAFSIP